MNIQALNEELFSFIQNSPSPYHAVFSAALVLQEHGFTELSEKQKWKLDPGGKYYVKRNGTSLFAFRMPEKTDGFPVTAQIIASHSDSPCFKLKGNSEVQVEDHYTKLNIEKYGSALMAPWFDRPLSIAGRVLVRTENGLKPCLVNFDRDLVMIVNLAIHMNREANNGIAYHTQSDLLPLAGSGQKDFSIRKMVSEQLQISEDQIYTMDLFVYNRMPGTIWGADNEFISAPRLDDLQCAFSSIQALCRDVNPDILTAAVIFDNEEVGSQSYQGAGSTFLKECLERIYLSLGADREDFLSSMACSFLLSADSGHALHPNYRDKSDPFRHPYVNGGVLVKYSANQKYTSDAVTGGLFRLLCEQKQIPFQDFYNHSDILGGSTLGNLSMSQVSIPTVDIGVAMLAMHSPYETAGAKDTLALYQSMCAFYQTKFQAENDGSYQLI